MKNINELDLANKKYIIFDLDGTLIDSVGLYALADQKLIELYGGRTVSFDTIRREADEFFLQAGKEENMYLAYAQYLIDRYNLSIKDKYELLEIRGKIDRTLMRTELQLKNGVVELIYLLKRLGYTLIIATMTPKSAVDNAFKNNPHIRASIDINLFDLVLTQEDVKNKKPHPEVFYKVLEHFNAEAQECVIFEDSLGGVRAARDAGIEVVNVFEKFSNKDRDRLNEISDYYVQSIEDVVKFIKDNLDREKGKPFVITKR